VYELVAVREPADDEPMAMRDSLIKDGGAALKQRERWELIQLVSMSVCYSLTVASSRNSLYTAKAAINEVTAGGYETTLAVGYATYGGALLLPRRRRHCRCRCRFRCRCRCR